MSIHKTKEEVIIQKKKSIIMLNNLLENLISDDETIRKADLISKWIKDYVNYINFEDTFDPKKNIAYKRGNIVKVNLGFNLGRELGGVHYAVVIDNENFQSSDTITILPLCSAKEDKELYKRDLFIGNEFYNLVSSKYKNALSETKQKLNSILEIKNKVNNLIHNNNSDSNKQIADELITKLSNEANEITKEVEYLQKCKTEIDMMKEGSIVKIEQIRTITKMRIWIPKKSTDPLYGISLSQPTMDKINTKFQELFCFCK